MNKRICLLVLVVAMATSVAFADAVVDPNFTIGTTTGTLNFTFTPATPTTPGSPFLTVSQSHQSLFFTNGQAGYTITSLDLVVESTTLTGNVVLNCPGSLTTISFFSACTPSQIGPNNPMTYPQSFTFSGGTGVSYGTNFSLDTSGWGQKSGSVQLTAHFTQNQIPTPTVPEPTSLLLFGSGLLGLAGMIRRRG